MKTSARASKLLLLVVFLLFAFSACAPHADHVPARPGNVPSGSGGTPEPGTNGAPQVAPNGHNESIVATSDVAFVGSDNHTLYAIGTTDGKVRWQYKAADAVLVYAVVNGVVYATAQNTLYALNTSSGSLLWTYRAAVQLSEVQVSAGIVFANTAAERSTSTLAALDATTGALLWKDSLASVTPGLLGIIDGTVYDAQTPGDPGAPGSAQIIHALRASDGHPLWQASVAGADGAVYNAPASANGVVYFATSSGALYAFDAATGRLRWHSSSAGGQPFAPLSSLPVVANGLVYVGAAHQGIAAYRASDGARQWQYALPPAGGPFPPQPVVSDGVVYVGNMGGLVVALRASDGSVIWQQHTPGVMLPLVLSNGLLISDAGPVFALRASDGALVWQSSVSPSGEGSSAGLPETVSAGVVYIGGDNGTVTALQASSGSRLWKYAIQELPEQIPPVYYASATFAAAVSYDQAIEIVMNLGLKTFIGCPGFDERTLYAGNHALLVAAMVNSAPLWLGRLKTTPGVTDAQPLTPIFNCPAERSSNGPPLPQNQVGTYLRVTFAQRTPYAAALEAVNGLGFRLADPCYEQARAAGKKPAWHPMGQADLFAQTPALVLATTDANVITWADQLKAAAGVVTVDVPFRATC